MQAPESPSDTKRSRSSSGSLIVALVAATFFMENLDGTTQDVAANATAEASPA